MKIRLMKSMDKILGPFLARILIRQTSNFDFNPHSFLLLRPGGIGDAVLLAPAINSLKQKYPMSSLTVLSEKRNAAVFSLSQHVDRVLLYDEPKELLAAIRGKYDVVIDTEQWHRLSAVVARFTRSSLSIGFATNERKRMFTNAVRYSHEDYERNSFFHLLDPLGIASYSMESPFLVVPEAASIKANIFLGDLADRSFVAIFPGSSIPEKRWDIRYFAELAMKINQTGFPVVVIGSGNERLAGEAIVDGLDALNLAGETSLVETAALIDRSSLLVSGDSGVLHIAAGLGTPTVSLFGPSNIKKWAPKGEQHITISKNLACSPCSKFGYTPKCPINAKCMQDITVDEVFAAVEKLMLLHNN